MRFHNLSDARRLSIRRLTIRRQLFVFVSPSEATDNPLGGQRSEEVVFAVHCSGIERRTAINCATDIRARVCDCFWFHDQGPNDNQFARRRSEEVEFVVRCSGLEWRTTINCATDFQAGVFDCVCPPNVSRTNHSQASASQRNRRQAVAGYGIERGHRVERAVDLWFIAVLC